MNNTFVVDLGIPPTDDPMALPPSDPHSVIGVNPSRGPFSGGPLWSGAICSGLRQACGLETPKFHRKTQPLGSLALKLALLVSHVRSSAALSPIGMSNVTPPELTSTVPVSVGLSGKPPDVAYDAFTYTESDNGLNCELSGAPLARTLKVALYDSYSAAPNPAGQVIAGDGIDSASTGKTDSAGILILQDSRLNKPVSVTDLKECLWPTTFVDVLHLAEALQHCLGGMCGGQVGRKRLESLG